MALKRLALSCAFLLVASCDAVGPTFRAPTIDQASRFAFAPQVALQQAADDEWWTALDDPLLDRLMAKAMVQNLDIERARSRVEAARALLATVGENARFEGGVTAQSTASRTESTGWQTTSTGTFRPSFIVDLFGEQKRLDEAAHARANAEEYDRAAVRLAVQLELVDNYLTLRTQESLLVEQKRSIANRARVVHTLKVRVRAGDAILVDLRRAEAELSTTRARVPTLVAARKLAALRIATLLAEPVQSVLPKLEKSKGQPVPKRGINAGVPAALLRNRPDIRRAEADFAARVAEIGVNQARLYPSLRINGTVQAAADSGVSLGPVLSIPLLDLPVRRARVASARASAAEAQTVWRQTVLSATEEVQAALVRLEEANDRLQRLNDSVRAYKSADRLAREAFDLGSITLSQVLDTEESAASVRSEHIRARQAYALAWAQLHVALGQGWHQNGAPREGGMSVASAG